MCVWSRVILLVCGPDWSSSEVVGNMGGNSFFFFFSFFFFLYYIILFSDTAKTKEWESEKTV